MRKERPNSRFVEILPMSLEEIGSAGCNLKIDYSFAKTQFGKVLVASTPRGICYLSFVTRKKEAMLRELRHRFSRATYEECVKEIHKKAVEIIGTAHKDRLPRLPLHIRGTEFQLNVWRELLAIPFGTLKNYQDIARKLQNPYASQALGNAIGRNPVAILIPCHRVIRKDLSLGGYRWGEERKAKIIYWEYEYLE